MALTQKDYSEKCYRNRRGNNLCPRCGAELDREGHYCRRCRDKANEYQRENRAFYISVRVCPYCRKETLFGEERQCIECREKAYARRKPYTEEQRERYNNRFRSQQRSLYRERAEKGICTRCGKRKPIKGKKKCKPCLIYDANKHKKPPKEQKKKPEGICYFCNNPVMTGKTICENHFSVFSENGKRNAKKILLEQ